MKKSCEICGKEFEAVRDTARFCSGGCRVKAGRVSVTPLEVLSVTKGLSVTDIPVLSVTPTVSVTSQDDIWSDDYDTSEAGFARRNKNWSDFKPAFRADTVSVCKRINKDHLAEIVAHDVMRAEVEGKSAVRGQA